MPKKYEYIFGLFTDLWSNKRDVHNSSEMKLEF